MLASKVTAVRSTCDDLQCMCTRRYAVYQTCQHHNMLGAPQGQLEAAQHGVIKAGGCCHSSDITRAASLQADKLVEDVLHAYPGCVRCATVADTSETHNHQLL